MTLENGFDPSLEDLFEWIVGAEAVLALENARRLYRAVRIAKLVNRELCGPISPVAILENAKSQTCAQLSDRYHDDLLVTWALNELSK